MQAEWLVDSSSESTADGRQSRQSNECFSWNRSIHNRSIRSFDPRRASKKVKTQLHTNDENEEAWRKKEREVCYFMLSKIWTCPHRLLFSIYISLRAGSKGEEHPAHDPFLERSHLPFPQARGKSERTAHISHTPCHGMKLEAIAVNVEKLNIMSSLFTTSELFILVPFWGKEGRADCYALAPASKRTHCYLHSRTHIL